MYVNVNPGIINPKRMFNWDGSILVDEMTGGVPPPIFINHAKKSHPGTSKTQLLIINYPMI